MSKLSQISAAAEIGSPPNAYGLTETSSTIAVMGTEEHRAAFASDDPAVRARLGWVGRPLPTLELEIRGADGEVLPTG